MEWSRGCIENRIIYIFDADIFSPKFPAYDDGPFYQIHDNIEINSITLTIIKTLSNVNFVML